MMAAADVSTTDAGQRVCRAGDCRQPAAEVDPAAVPAWASEHWETARAQGDQDLLDSWRDAAQLWADEPWSRRCNIPRWQMPQGAARDELLERGTVPFISKIPLRRNAPLRERLRRETLLSEMAEKTCTPTPAGSTRGGHFEMTVAEYVEEWMPRGTDSNAA